MPESPTRITSEAAYLPHAGAAVAAVSSEPVLTRGLRQASLWLIVVLVASYTFLDYWTYSFDYHAHPETYDLFLHGRGTAPAQYRIGLIFAAKVLHSVAHLGYRHSFTLFDFIFALGAAYLLRGILAGSQAFRAAGATSRWLRVGIFLGLLSFYFSWSLWYQRPETMACAFFVASSLYLLCLVRSQAIVVAGLLVLAVLQGLVRADVAILFHLGLFLYVLVRGSKGFLVSRGVLLVTSLAGCVLPTAILWVLMHKVFPHATYGDTKVFQLLSNIGSSQLVPFLLFMVPTLYTYKRASARFSRLESSFEGAQVALLLMAVFYLCSWVTVGRMQEVRIFVPFALALMPLTANLAADEIALTSV